MKLIDLLVQELPKLGGWPRGAAICERFLHESHIDFYDEEGNWPEDCGKKYGFSFAKELVQPRQSGRVIRTEVVKKDEYEAALAASKQVAWDGEGLPPVGCDCEVKGAHGDESWSVGKILSHTKFKGRDCAVFQTEETVSVSSYEYFRPIRTEAERKREEAINDIASMMGCGTFFEDATGIYDAITAGKIPGIKLAD